MNPEATEHNPKDFKSTLIELLENSEIKPSKASLEVIGQIAETNNKVVIFFEFNNSSLRDAVANLLPVNSDIHIQQSDPSNLIIRGAFSKEDLEKLKQILK